jgi:hypothetical protein
MTDDSSSLLNRVSDVCGFVWKTHLSTDLQEPVPLLKALICIPGALYELATEYEREHGEDTTAAWRHRGARLYLRPIKLLRAVQGGSSFFFMPAK